VSESSERLTAIMLFDNIKEIFNISEDN